jgi:hypothetical protein
MEKHTRRHHEEELWDEAQDGDAETPPTDPQPDDAEATPAGDELSAIGRRSRLANAGSSARVLIDHAGRPRPSRIAATFARQSPIAFSSRAGTGASCDHLSASDRSIPIPNDRRGPDASRHCRCLRPRPRQTRDQDWVSDTRARSSLCRCRHTVGCLRRCD